MTIRRGLLYTGVFLVAIGAVTLLASAGVLAEDRLIVALASWPIGRRRRCRLASSPPRSRA